MSRTQKKIDKVKKISRGDGFLTQDEKNEINRQKEDEISKRRKKILNTAFATDEGKEALRLIMDISGWAKYDAVARRDSGMIDTTTSMYNMARRSVYLDLRQYINQNILIETEHQHD